MGMNQTLQEASSAGTGPTDVLRTPALQKQSLADIALFLTLCIHASHPQEISSQNDASSTHLHFLSDGFGMVLTALLFSFPGCK